MNQGVRFLKKDTLKKEANCTPFKHSFIFRICATLFIKKSSEMPLENKMIVYIDGNFLVK